MGGLVHKDRLRRNAAEPVLLLGLAVLAALLGAGGAAWFNAVPIATIPATLWALCTSNPGQAGGFQYPRSPRGHLDHQRLRRRAAAAAAENL